MVKNLGGTQAAELHKKKQHEVHRGSGWLRSAAPRARGNERRRAAAAVVHTHNHGPSRPKSLLFILLSFPSSLVLLGLFRSLIVIRRRDDHPLGSWTVSCAPELQAQLRTYEVRQSLSCNGK